MISTAVEIEDSIDLTLIKQNHSSSPSQSLSDLCVVHKTEINTDTNTELKPDIHALSNHPIPTFTVRRTKDLLQLPVECSSVIEKSNSHTSQKCDQSTQTDVDPPKVQNVSDINTNIPLFQNIKVKEEPKNVEIPKSEEDYPMDTADNFFLSNIPSDNSDDISLVNLQKKKRKRPKNGDVEGKKKKKPKLKEWEYLVRTLPEGTALTVVEPELKVTVKQEASEPDLPRNVKTEPVEFHCCICFVQCYSRNEMLQHYKYVSILFIYILIHIKIINV